MADGSKISNMTSTTMTEHAERVSQDHVDRIETTDTFVRHEAEVGREVLKNLTAVDQTPALTFRNVFRATDTRTTLTSITLILTYTAALMEYSIPTSQIPFIIQDLGRPELTSWLSTASTCATSAILPSMSSFTDVFGRRYALLFGSLLGLAGALVAGFAPSTEIVILGQALSGAGVGFTFISAASLAEIVPAFTRPFWGSTQHASGNLMALLGPIYAGALMRATPSGWRWMFWINGIAYGISFLLIFFMYQEKSRVKALGLTTKTVLQRFDYLGLLLLTGGTVSFLCGLSWGGDKRYGWKSPHAIAPTVCGAVVLIFVLPLYELHVAKYPLVDRSLFRTRNFVVLNVQTFVMGFIQFSTYVYLPQLLVAFWEKDPLKLGVDRLPLAGGLFAAVLLSGLIFQRTGRAKRSYLVYSSLMLLGPALFAILKPSHPVGVPIGLSLITGVGVGGATGLGFILVQYSVPQHLMGIGIGCLTTLRSFGGSVGVAIFNSILRSKQIGELPGTITNAALGAGATQKQAADFVQAALAGSTQRIANLGGGNTDLINAVISAYKHVLSDSYRLVFLATIPFGVLGLIMTFFLQEVSQYLSDEVVFGLKHESPADCTGETEKPVRQ